jgi:hypothetical protein
MNLTEDEKIQKEYLTYIKNKDVIALDNLYYSPIMTEDRKRNLLRSLFSMHHISGSKFLLDKGIKLTNAFALHGIASKKECVNFLKFLNDNNVDLKVNGGILIFQAACELKIKNTEYLLNGCDYDSTQVKRVVYMSIKAMEYKIKNDWRQQSNRKEENTINENIVQMIILLLSHINNESQSEIINKIQDDKIKQYVFNIQLNMNLTEKEVNNKRKYKI